MKFRSDPSVMKIIPVGISLYSGKTQTRWNLEFLTLDESLTLEDEGTAS
jgi:hypothetical protein